MVRKSNGETTDFLKSFHSETSYGPVRWVETHTAPWTGERRQDLCPSGGRLTPSSLKAHSWGCLSRSERHTVSLILKWNNVLVVEFYRSKRNILTFPFYG